MYSFVVNLQRLSSSLLSKYSSLASILASRFTLSGAGFVCGVGLASILGPSILGYYSYIISSATILAVVLNLGTEVPYNIHAARRPNAFVNFMHMATGQAVLASLAAGAIWLLASNIGLRIPGSALLLIAAVFAIVLNQLTYAIAAGAQKQVRVNLTLAALIILQPLFVYALIQAGVMVLESAIIAYAAVFITSPLITYVLMLGRVETNFSYRRAYREISLEGRHNLVANISGIIRLRSPILFLSPHVTGAGLGIYQVSQSLSELLYLVPVAVSTAILSLNSSDKNLMKVALRYSTVSIAITTIATIVIVISMGWIVPLLYGDEFAPVIGTARIMLFGTIAFAISKCCSSILYKQSSSRNVAQIEIVAAASSLALTPAAISHWGVMGAAWSFVFTAWLTALLYVGVLTARTKWKRTRLRPH